MFHINFFKVIQQTDQQTTRLLELLKEANIYIFVIGTSNVTLSTGKLRLIIYLCMAMCFVCPAQCSDAPTQIGLTKRSANRETFSVVVLELIRAPNTEDDSIRAPYCRQASPLSPNTQFGSSLIFAGPKRGRPTPGFSIFIRSE